MATHSCTQMHVMAAGMLQVQTWGAVGLKKKKKRQPVFNRDSCMERADLCQNTKSSLHCHATLKRVNHLEITGSDYLLSENFKKSLRLGGGTKWRFIKSYIYSLFCQRLALPHKLTHGTGAEFICSLWCAELRSCFRYSTCLLWYL